MLGYRGSITWYGAEAPTDIREGKTGETFAADNEELL